MTEHMEANQDRLTWVEPEISTLAIEETAGLPFPGGDGGGNPDCTNS